MLTLCDCWWSKTVYGEHMRVCLRGKNTFGSPLRTPSVCLRATKPINGKLAALRSEVYPYICHRSPCVFVWERPIGTCICLFGYFGNGYGSKLNHPGTAGFSLRFVLPGFYEYLFFTHSQMESYPNPPRRVSRMLPTAKNRPAMMTPPNTRWLENSCC